MSYCTSLSRSRSSREPLASSMRFLIEIIAHALARLRSVSLSTSVPAWHSVSGICSAMEGVIVS